jgi:hypothetical protein
MEDLVTQGTAAGSSDSDTEALSGITVFREGAAGASSCVSSSSLKMRNGFFTAWKSKRSRKQKTTNSGTQRNTYESMRSNISTPSSRQGAAAAEVF